jgi:hypothetical protein
MDQDKSRLTWRANFNSFYWDVPTSDSPTNNEQIAEPVLLKGLELLERIQSLCWEGSEGMAKHISLPYLSERGKTFVAANLWRICIIKKILLVGMDIRNPRLDEYLNIPERFTNYLPSKDLKLRR